MGWHARVADVLYLTRLWSQERATAVSPWWWMAHERSDMEASWQETQPLTIVINNYWKESSLQNEEHNVVMKYQVPMNLTRHWTTRLSRNGWKIFKSNKWKWEDNRTVSTEETEFKLQQQGVLCKNYNSFMTVWSKPILTTASVEANNFITFVAETLLL